MFRFHNQSEQKTIRKKLRKTSTVQEIILWSRLKNKQLGCKFRRQHSIGRYIVDFCSPEKMLIIEVDGWQHKKEKQERHDKERSKYLESLGFKIIRFWNNDINDNIEGVVTKILESFKK